MPTGVLKLLLKPPDSGGTIRTVVLDPAKDVVSTTTDFVTVKPKCELHGGNMKSHLENQLAGMIVDMVKAAAGDTDTFATMVTAMSIKKKLIYKIGWLVKPVAKIINKLKIGTVAKWTKKETGLKKEDWAPIADESVLEFIIKMVLNLYGGENLYDPDDAHYKIAMGLISIFDSVFDALHINVRKLLKTADSLYDFAEPLIHNRGIPAYNTVLPIMPYYNEGEQGPVPEDKKPEHTLRSRKGPWIIAIAVLAVIILFIPLVLVLGAGFIANQIKYGKKMKIDE